MPEIINQLQIDHQNISRLLRLLEEQTANLEAGEYTDLQLIADIMHYFVNYPDVQHHPREDLIFSAIKGKAADLDYLIEEIEQEHKSMAEDSIRIQEEISQMQGNAIISREKIVTHLKNYIKIYYSHIEKEEGTLFSQAQNLLTESDWERIDSEMMFVDDPLFGKILNDQYASLYKVILAGVSS